MKHPPISDDVRRGIERDAAARIKYPSDKELMSKWKVSRATLYRVLRAARLRQLSQSEKSETREDSAA